MNTIFSASVNNRQSLLLSLPSQLEGLAKNVSDYRTDWAKKGVIDKATDSALSINDRLRSEPDGAFHHAPHLDGDGVSESLALSIKSLSGSLLFIANKLDGDRLPVLEQVKAQKLIRSTLASLSHVFRTGVAPDSILKAPTDITRLAEKAVTASSLSMIKTAGASRTLSTILGSACRHPNLVVNSDREHALARSFEATRTLCGKTRVPDLYQTVLSSGLAGSSLSPELRSYLAGHFLPIISNTSAPLTDADITLFRRGVREGYFPSASECYSSLLFSRPIARRSAPINSITYSDFLLASRRAHSSVSGTQTHVLAASTGMVCGLTPKRSANESEFNPSQFSKDFKSALLFDRSNMTPREFLRHTSDYLPVLISSIEDKNDRQRKGIDDISPALCSCKLICSSALSEAASQTDPDLARGLDIKSGPAPL